MQYLLFSPFGLLLAPILVADFLIIKEIYNYARSKRAWVVWLGFALLCTMLGLGYTSKIFLHLIGCVFAGAPLVRLFMTLFKKTGFRYGLTLTVASIECVLVLLILAGQMVALTYYNY